jgi:HlyD family secretion protein
VSADYEQARLQAQADEQLFKEGLQSELTTKLSRVRAEQAAIRDGIEKKRVAQINESQRAQLEAQRTEVARVRVVLRLRQSQVQSLKVRPGTDGMLQEVPVQVGQRVGAGTNLARIANQTRLKAELKIPETQAKDLLIGQRVSIDTRNGLIDAHLSRIDPAVREGFVTVDAALDGPLPKGARPDLSVDGVVELERLENVLFVGRPAYGQEQSTVTIFKIDNGGGYASRVKVTLGRFSVSSVEVKTGLREGDQVILSDMSQYDGTDRVRIR